MPRCYTTPPAWWAVSELTVRSRWARSVQRRVCRAVWDLVSCHSVAMSVLNHYAVHAHIMLYNDNSDTRNGHFQTTRVSPVPLSGFYWSKDDGSGGNVWSYKTWKAPMKSAPPANQHPWACYRQDALPVDEPTASEHLRENISHSTDWLTPSLPWDVPSLSWPLKVPICLVKPVVSPVMPT